MRKRTRAILSAATAAAMTATGLALAGPAQAVSPDVVISEVYGGGGNSGAALKQDFIELYNAGTAEVSVDGWSVQYASSAGTTWQVTELAGVIPPGRYYLIGLAFGSGGTVDLPPPDVTGTIPMSGSSGKVALVTDSTALSCGATLGSCSVVPSVRDFVGYGTTTSDSETAPTGTNLTSTTSASRTPVTSDTDSNALDFTTGAPTPIACGEDCAAPPPPDPDPVTCDTVVTHTIPQVQGDGEFTPLTGQTVTVNGVVVADLQEGGYDGFHLQDPVGDGNPATSDAVFIFAPEGLDVAVGDSVAVTGTAGEFFGLTQISAGSLVVCEELAFPLPAAVPLDLPLDDAGFETLEGMFVVPADTLTVTEVFNLNRFGEVVLSEGGRLFAPTEVAEVGPDSIAVAADNQTRRVVLDDGRDFNLAFADPPVPPPFLTPDDPVRVGDTATFIEPVVLSFGFGAWRLQPVDGLGDTSTFAPTNPRPETPEDVGGNAQTAAFNVLNYFTTLTSENSEARGADTPEEFQKQEAKIVEAISLLGADVVALQEIENSVALGEQVDEALATLVAALNTDAGSDVWGFVPSPANLPPPDQQDVITNAIIYRVDAVERVGESVARNNEAVWFNAREPIAQTFRPLGEGSDDPFTVVSNHFKSKGGSGTGDNEDTGPGGQGSFNGDRTRQAEDLVLFVDELVASTGDPDVLLLGDFNAYSMEDPIEVLEDAGLVNLGPLLNPGEDSYVFNGETGSLDHAIVTTSVVAKVTGVDYWNINAVESFGYQYDGTPSLYSPDQFRASDHDPILVGLELEDDRTPGDRLRELIRRILEFLRDRFGRG